jgi:hypothetical protein
MTEKIVYLKRCTLKGVLPEEGVDSYSDTRVTISAARTSRNSSIPLGRTIFPSTEIEEKTMAKILGIQPTAIDFETRLNKYWYDFEILVPTEGLPLNLTTNDKGEYLNLLDYVRYLYCTKSREVANSVEDINKSPNIICYLEKPMERIENAQVSIKMRDAATVEKLKIMTNTSLTDAVILLHCMMLPNNLKKK